MIRDANQVQGAKSMTKIEPVLLVDLFSFFIILKHALLNDWIF